VFEASVTTRTLVGAVGRQRFFAGPVATTVRVVGKVEATVREG
jgi:hypothetical protein